MNEEKKLNGREVEINRAAIGHRAAWMGLIYDEAVKEGVDLEEIIRRAISRRGSKDGERFHARCEDDQNLVCFRDVFIDELGMNTFEMDITECTKDDLKIQFHHCPLLAAWKELGMNDAQCVKLCDMAMDGDRGIAKEMGLQFDLNGTIAEGCEVCNLHFHK